MDALAGQAPRRVDRRSIEVAGFANGGDAVQKIKQRRTLGELQGVIGRQMDMHVDQAGQGEASGELGDCGLSRRDRGNLAVGDCYRLSRRAFRASD